MTSIISSEQSTTLPFVVTFITLGLAWAVLYIWTCLQLCIECLLDQRREPADVLQTANNRKWLNRVTASPRRARGRTRALEFDMSSSDDEVILKYNAADTKHNMRTRSSYKNYS